MDRREAVFSLVCSLAWQSSRDIVATSPETAQEIQNTSGKDEAAVKNLVAINRSVFASPLSQPISLL